MSEGAGRRKKYEGGVEDVASPSSPNLLCIKAISSSWLNWISSKSGIPGGSEPEGATVGVVRGDGLGSERGGAWGVGSGGAMSVLEWGLEAGLATMGRPRVPEITRGTSRGKNYKEKQEKTKQKR